MITDPRFYLLAIPAVAVLGLGKGGWGALSGFMSLLVQVGAPPFQIYILPQRLDKLTLAGTSVIFFAFMNWMTIVPYFVLGQFRAQFRHLARAGAACNRRQSRRHLAGAQNAAGLVLSDRLRADAFDLARAAVAGLDWPQPLNPHLNKVQRLIGAIHSGRHLRFCVFATRSLRDLLNS
jgi:hypothetical protein